MTRIDRKAWVSRHDPILCAAEPQSPLTVGNGSIALSADITGMQTLYEDYLVDTPLCIMANWGWHITPADNQTGFYTHADVKMDHYDFCGREVRYAQHPQPGNEHVYDWLRKNPHKFSLARIGLRLDGETIHTADVQDAYQQLHLYEGWLESRFTLRGKSVSVQTACADETNTLLFRIASPLLPKGLTVDIDLPYPAVDISGADWSAAHRHTTTLEGNLIRAQANDFRYALRLNAPGAALAQTSQHSIRITPSSDVLELAVTFGKDAPEAVSFAPAFCRCMESWGAFGEKGGAIDLSEAQDERALELERRIVLSLYLLAINSSGNVPPAETGLTCNSWYGKAHLEMHFWHMAWAPLWGHGMLLERSLPWYHAHLPNARANAARNGYRGARWMKMVGDNGVDSPSNIAVLLVWQQPHIITMLELLRRTSGEKAARKLMQEQWQLVKETAEFMADYAVEDEAGVYHIAPPVIPVQERHKAEETVDPSFEVAYWKHGLGIAIQWAEALGEEVPALWRDVHSRMATPPMHDDLYTAHSYCPNTFVDKAIDHPSMLQSYGVLPQQDIDEAAMARTLDKVIECWDYVSLWGWDFAVMAMTAVRLGKPSLALDQLLCISHKNTYVRSGNNRQISRRDLPLYLPGNGSLLLAAAMMAGGYDGSGALPGFPAESGWKAHCDGIHPYI